MLQTGLKMGFGLMRLPRNEDGSFSVERTSKMVDAFIEAGGTYFDTAYAYAGSEECARKALVERYPRERYTLTSKLTAFGDGMNIETAKNEINVSLERLGVDYLDLYLLHCIQRNNIENYDNWKLWDYVKELKEKGLIKHWGFSFHADPALLEELLIKHPDVEFVQLQINYADMENLGVSSRANLEICRKYNKPVIVMEPVKGGILANPIDTVKAILDKENTMSYAGWAMRFAGSQEGVFAVLTGASSEAQMDDNLSCMKDFKPLDEHENEVIKACQKALDDDKSIPCTGCRYCTKGCPMNIPIPDIFNVKNRKMGQSDFKSRREYSLVTLGKGKASDCVQCGQCEGVCPQHLNIIELIEDCKKLED